MVHNADAVASLRPALAVGERVSLRVRDREVLGFVTELGPDAVTVLDRRGAATRIDRREVAAIRRVGVALGRDPLAAPRTLLDALAARAGVSGTPWVCRISTLVGGRTPPATVPAWGETAEFGDLVARCEGEWVTLGGDVAAVADAVVDAAWWATRAGARSVQVRCDRAADATPLVARGFVRR